MKLLYLLRRGQRPQGRAVNATAGTENTSALRAANQPSLWLHRGKCGHWWWAGGYPISSAPQVTWLDSILLAELWQQQHHADPQTSVPLFVPSQSVATKMTVKANPSTGGSERSAGKLVGLIAANSTRRGWESSTEQAKWENVSKGQQDVPPGSSTLLSLGKQMPLVRVYSHSHGMSNTVKWCWGQQPCPQPLFYSTNPAAAWTQTPLLLPKNSSFSPISSLCW